MATRWLLALFLLVAVSCAPRGGGHLGAEAAGKVDPPGGGCSARMEIPPGQRPPAPLRARPPCESGFGTGTGEEGALERGRAYCDHPDRLRFPLGNGGATK